jgi:hypothetical protein
MFIARLLVWEKDRNVLMKAQNEENQTPFFDSL